MKPEDDAPDVADVLREVRSTFGSLAKDVNDAFQKIFDEAEYRFDKELGRQMAKNPDLYAEVKRTYKSVKRTLDKVAGDLGLK